MTRHRKFAFIVVLILLVTASTFASDKDIIKVQGVVMSIDPKKKLVNINERSYVWDQKTAFYNERGTPGGIDRIRPRTWVYIEAVTGTDKGPVARKIYQLPNFIDEKEKHRYPFIR